MEHYQKAKTFKISEKLWAKVAQDKIDLRLKSHEDVIWYLYKNLNKTGGKKN